MTRFGKLNLVLILLLLLPAAAAAQGETTQTREGAKFIGLAMTRSDAAERAEMYREAMTHLRIGMERDPENSRVWLLAGTALAGLGELVEADEAFTRALSLNPEYEEEIEVERFDAWVQAFNRGLELMESGQEAEALRQLEGAEIIHGGRRPEALMYLGVLYANHAGDLRKAEESFRASLEATQGPNYDAQDPETQAEWTSMREALEDNIERMMLQRGVLEFQEENYDEAIEVFKTLSTANPHSRDVWFNYSQSLLAKTQLTTDVLDSMSEAEAARAKQEVLPLLRELDEVTEKTLEMDPNNELLYMVLAQSERMQGEFAGDSASLDAGQRAAIAVLQRHAALPVVLDQISLQPTEEGAMLVTGLVKNLNLDEGAEVRLNMELLARDGSVIGAGTITFAAPAAEAAAQFEGTIPVDGEVNSWRYTVGT